MNGEVAPERLGRRPGQEVVRVLPQNGARPSYQRTSNRCSPHRSRPQGSADEIWGTRGTAEGDRQTDGPSRRWPGYEGRLSDFWLVRSQPLSPAARSKLETRNGK